MPIRTTRGAASARGFGFTGGGLFQVLLTLSSDTTDYNLYTAAISSGWDGTSDANVSLTINPGVNVHSTSPGTSAFSVPSSFPAGTLVTINNAGIIVGRGGNGGAAQPGHGGMNAGLPGAAGGPALLVTRPITLVNNNRVAGGGGGGGGGGCRAGPGRAYGGGGGGGVTFGSGGGSHAGPHGQPGTLTAGGTSSGTFPGGTGGGYGSSGNNGTPGPDGAGGTGGSSGTAINGYSLITLSGTGQINGPTTG